MKSYAPHVIRTVDRQKNIPVTSRADINISVVYKFFTVIAKEYETTVNCPGTTEKTFETTNLIRHLKHSHSASVSTSQS